MHSNDDKTSIKAKSLRPRLRPKFGPRGHFGLEAQILFGPLGHFGHFGLEGNITGKSRPNFAD